MTQGEFKIEVDSKITEQIFIENCLMHVHSGNDPLLFLLLYALSQRWKVDKLTYYLNLLGIGEKSNE